MKNINNMELAIHIQLITVLVIDIVIQGNASTLNPLDIIFNALLRFILSKLYDFHVKFYTKILK